jgi:L-alanine-DL-glutamate epimerase-like enolase superfamily enzyme
MKVVEAWIQGLSIPLTHRFRHALAARSESDSVMVKVVSDAGIVGYGEGVPRAYVTGETQAACMAHIRDVLLPRVMGMEFGDVPIEQLLVSVSGMLPEGVWDGKVAWQAARAAVELALLDCVLKSRQTSLAAALPPMRGEVVYSAVIGMGDVEATTRLARWCRAEGFTAVKLKVGSFEDVGLVGLVRDLVGPDMSLRLDANGAFELGEAIAFAESVAPFEIACIEQPMPVGDDLAPWTELCASSAVPIMADERVVTFGDAAALVAARAADMFNLRVSKCGGIYETLRLCRYAREHGMGVQLGCQVGESCVLSAAGRHLAAHLPELLFCEGSYGTRLLSEDLSCEPVGFDEGGRAALLTRPGLGVDVDARRLVRHSQGSIHVVAS